MASYIHSNAHASRWQRVGCTESWCKSGVWPRVSTTQMQKLSVGHCSGQRVGSRHRFRADFRPLCRLRSTWHTTWSPCDLAPRARLSCQRLRYGWHSACYAPGLKQSFASSKRACLCTEAMRGLWLRRCHCVSKHCRPLSNWQFNRFASWTAQGEQPCLGALWLLGPHELPSALVPKAGGAIWFASAWAWFFLAASALFQGKSQLCRHQSGVTLRARTHIVTSWDLPAACALLHPTQVLRTQIWSGLGVGRFDVNTLGGFPPKGSQDCQAAWPIRVWFGRCNPSAR